MQQARIPRLSARHARATDTSSRRQSGSMLYRNQSQRERRGRNERPGCQSLREVFPVRPKQGWKSRKDVPMELMKAPALTNTKHECRVTDQPGCAQQGERAFGIRSVACLAEYQEASDHREHNVRPHIGDFP